MNALQIGITIFGFWLSIIGPLSAMMIFLHNKIEKTDERWIELLKDFCDFKNVTVERFSKLENKDK